MRNVSFLAGSLDTTERMELSDDPLRPRGDEMLDNNGKKSDGENSDPNERDALVNSSCIQVRGDGG